MADGLIKKIFSFARKSSAGQPAGGQDEPALAEPAMAEKTVIAATEQTPFEAWQAEQQAIAAQKEQAAKARLAPRRPAAPRLIDEAGLTIRPQAGDASKAAASADEKDEAKAAPQSWLARLKHGMAQSSRRLNSSLGAVFTGRKLDETALEELENVLLQADLGLETAAKITDKLRAGRFGKDISPAEIRAIMADEIAQILQPCARALELDLNHKPHIILVVGVNGTGKTTTIGKLAAKLRAGGLSVMLAAGDTFRAAAIEQLHIWGQRTGAPVISSRLGADAASLVFDAYQQAVATGTDVLLIDTAGRLQNKTELMEELAKLVRVLQKRDPSAPHTVLQNLDATTGQNALSQVEIFKKTAKVNGLVMTKLDGTARGGILAAIAAKYKLPIYFIGVGEDIADLEPFSARDFAAAIVGEA
ncbi:MAG: signal recognition particle-docking protein FtsY [Candidatus Tokpelaia sp.]|uniref:signal recognition particle-docking protein FtsY n=1 Tax=Candidatus Tokpelaia sp. TaxID=2233777 RepID=UPI00123BA895|nr:signal recognition particle-docking protein FtsY [Candidatus Tokpelaia sp.]KAA6206032.1 MAG: signal recognition particle-docking protein FtsY [Candidatus Tokpelaia sp.]KAA6206182.1 MAG: signal recognition particle-docking protein FtsY [Candidatus Tokpelaia sp.]KAA6406079.1 signal recognition particle-docking protein FtsY [Candidatus Tokpelaia sp.]